MNPELAAFLEPRAADFSEQLAWRGGEHLVSLRGYFTSDTPPDAFVLAGRAIVIDGPRVLVVRNPDGEHILPGGRREPGETAIDAARREVVEETGWSIASPTAFSVLHVHYDTPEPRNVGRVIYPDFLWHVFIARPRSFDEPARQPDEYELGAKFHDIAELLARPNALERYQRILLEAAASREAFM
jgi:8-oxo-dGTP pyrophosphatase MutT (NUDIX family)